ncbi:MAG: hypothetical protein CMF25_07270 [Kangiellaceae bacterium]|nr:hypothetical protein [Kangiellaceae bacterium]
MKTKLNLLTVAVLSYAMIGCGGSASDDDSEVELFQLPSATANEGQTDSGTSVDEPEEQNTETEPTEVENNNITADGINGVWLLSDAEQIAEGSIEYRYFEDDAEIALEYLVTDGECKWILELDYENLGGDTYRENEGDGYSTTFNLTPNGKELTYNLISENDNGVVMELDISRTFPIANVTNEELAELCEGITPRPLSE